MENRNEYLVQKLFYGQNVTVLGLIHSLLTMVQSKHNVSNKFHFDLICYK